MNLADWSERQTFFLGRYHDLPGQLLMDACLRPGERVIDIGANIGLLSLHASALVGPGGIVDAFEPNPVCCDRIRSALEHYKIRNIRLHQMGLADSNGALSLRILENHSGMGTLAEVVAGAGPAVTSSTEVRVRIGDESLPDDSRPIALVKADVEGFEVKALRGLGSTLERFRPIVVTEIIAEWIQRAGSSVAELGEFMDKLGYDCFGLRTRRRLFRHHLQLVPCRAPGVLPEGMSDAVWAPRCGALAGRLHHLLA